jgi:hypothetical protein
LACRYHIYKQNQNRTNNNNATRVNLNVNRPEPVVQPAADEAPVNADRNSGEAASVEGNEQSQTSDAEPESTADVPASTVPDEPQVPLLTIVRTFILSFFSSIIPEAPAL